MEAKNHGMTSRLCLSLLDEIIISKDVCVFISWNQKIIHEELQNCILELPYNGKIWRVLYLANEPLKRNWRILIWRLRRGYYVAVHRKT